MASCVEFFSMQCDWADCRVGWGRGGGIIPLMGCHDYPLEDPNLLKFAINLNSISSQVYLMASSLNSDNFWNYTLSCAVERIARFAFPLLIPTLLWLHSL